jgi:tungstate transport system substrate-binding protein
MNSRRRTLVRWSAAIASVAASRLSHSAQRRSLDHPLRLAADDALMDSGLAVQLQRAFGRDTGVAVQLIRGPASALLRALERGEHDAALTNAPSVEAELERQGLVHDRRSIARAEFVLVGPSVLAKSLAAAHDVSTALARLAAAGAPFLTRADGSGTHLAEQALWRAAKLAPAAPWYLQATPATSPLTQAQSLKACTLVDKGAWTAHAAAAGYGVLVDGDPLLAVDVHVMRPFRGNHPSAKLFVNWIAGAQGLRVISGVRGYRVPVRT